jgi:hypothetical protein
MADYREGIKKEVVELKFLIHDLRVDNFINEVIHFHVTLDTDLEIYSIDQAQILHGEDLQVLREKAVALRRAFQDYSNAVHSFSPDRTILLAARQYIDTCHAICELILNPLWGRIDKVLTFLPSESRSVRGRNHYRNCVDWIGGVYRRIVNFLDEQRNEDVYQEFDVARELEDFTRSVIYGYVVEKSSARVELQLERLDPAVLGGNLPRFRRMFFNLVMNAVDAMSLRKVGVLSISETVEDDRVVLELRDTGVGMTQEKIKQLLSDRETLDGEIHSLGFVFVRQTIEEFGGELSIDSEPGKGTTMTVRLPHLPGAVVTDQPSGGVRRQDLPLRIDITPRDAKPPSAETGYASAVDGSGSSGRAAAEAGTGSDEAEDRDKSCGAIIYRDYERSEAQFPGAIFAISVDDDDRLHMFSHKPYERHWNITHEDLSPMLFQATARGRLEEDEEKRPVLIIKPPQNPREYFELREVPEGERSAEKHLQMVHDEHIRIARKLIDTGLSPQLGLHLIDAQKYFPEQPELADMEAFPLELLAKQELTS